MKISQISQHLEICSKYFALTKHTREDIKVLHYQTAVGAPSETRAVSSTPLSTVTLTALVIVSPIHSVILVNHAFLGLPFPLLFGAFPCMIMFVICI